MKKKLAYMCCAVLLAALLSACGGSGASTASETAKEETPAQETSAEADVQEDAAEKTEEAAPAADISAEAAAETAAETATKAAAEDSTEAASAAAAEDSSEAAATAAAAEDVLEGSCNIGQMSKTLTDIDLSTLPALEESKQLDVTVISEDDPEDKGITVSNGELYKYDAFQITEKDSGSCYSIIYYDLITDFLYANADLFRFNKSAGATADAIRNLDLEELYPGFYSLNCTDAQLYDKGDYYDLVIVFRGLDQDASLDEAVTAGALTISDYHYGCKISGSAVSNSMRASGYTELSDYELTKLNIYP